MIARAASWLWNEIAADQIDNAKAGKLTYLLNVQKGICQAIEEQKQLTELMSSGDILRDCRKSRFDKPDHLSIFAVFNISPY